MASGSSTDSSSSSSDEPTSKKSGLNYETKKSPAIISRPNASPGYWLSCLLPLALCVSYLKLQPKTVGVAGTSKCHAFASINADQVLAIAAVGMCVESLCFFLYMFVETGLLLKLFISFVPGLFATFLYTWLLQMSLSLSLLWGFAVTFCYQNAYIRVMRGLPQCFTFGEACILVQGCMLFLINCVLKMPQLLMGQVNLKGDEFAQVSAIMMSALLCLLLTCGLLAISSTLRRVYCFYSLMSLLLLGVTLMPVTKPLPVVNVILFVISDLRRIWFIFFCFLLVAATIGTVSWQLRCSAQKASTRMRKIFHVLIVLVYVPGLVYQCKLLYLASGVALAIFTVLELFRILNIPPLGAVLKSSFASFSDEKDAGLLALTPFSLLIGISMPLWLSPCLCGYRNQDTAVGTQLVPLMAGILSIGVGDTAASVIGSKFGYLHWRNSSRTLEGTFAYIVTVCLVVYILYICGLTSMTTKRWLITATAIFVTSLVEAHTNQIDNLALPLIFYIISSVA